MFYNDGWKILKNLFATGKTVVVVDPPFGGHIEPLAYTFKRLSDVAEMSNSSEELTCNYSKISYIILYIIISICFYMRIIYYEIIYYGHSFISFEGTYMCVNL